VKKLNLSVGLILALGCSKTPGAAGTDAAGAATTTAPTGTAPATATAPPPQSAAGGEVQATQQVSDCPKSLAGDENVARTIKKECGPIAVTANYAVNGTLTLEAGVVLKIAEGAEISVGYSTPAKIIVKGTAAEPVTLTSAGDAVPGFWKGLHLYRQANRSSLEGLVIEHAGDDRGALHIDARDVVVKGVTVRNAKEIGLRVGDEGTVTGLAGNSFEKAGKIALSLPPAALGGLGGASKFDDGAVVEVRHGQVTESAKWQSPGAPLLFTGNVAIDGKNVRASVELVAPLELRFAEGTELSVGYSQPGGLVAVAAADKPIVFTSGGGQEPGAWKGVHVYSNGEARLDGVTVSFGGADEDRGALRADNGATLDARNVSFTKNRVALVVEDDARVKGIDGCKFSGSEKKAVEIGADRFATLGAANSYAEGERIEIRGGRVSQTVTWNLQPGAIVEVQENVTIDNKGVATFAPGLELRFKDGVELSVGYSEVSSLRAVAPADKPIKLRGVREEAGAWDGLIFYGNAKDSALANVVVEHAGGDAGVIVRDGASAKIENLTCAKCSTAAIKWECGAKATVAGTKNTDGTPAAEVKPEGCAQ
jgi:hypothetical protein